MVCVDRCYELSGQSMRQWNTTEAHTSRSDNVAELPPCTCSLSSTMADMVKLVATGHHRCGLRTFELHCVALASLIFALYPKPGFFVTSVRSVCSQPPKQAALGGG